MSVQNSNKLLIIKAISKENITLVPLMYEHESSLTALSSEKVIWQFVPEQYHKPNIFKEKWFNKAMKQIQNKERVCFTIFSSGEMVGSSSYYDIDIENKKINIGYTWFHPSVWGTKINPLSKLLMLEYAFETLELSRVGFSVDSLNEKSCRALEKLGIKREGTLRNHLILSDGRIRHSVMFSVIKEEWADIKNGIHAILGLL